MTVGGNFIYKNFLLRKTTLHSRKQICKYYKIGCVEFQFTSASFHLKCN